MDNAALPLSGPTIFDGISSRWTHQSAQALAFRMERHVVLRQLVSDPLLRSLDNYAKARACRALSHDDADVPGTPSFYADPVMEELLSRLTQSVGNVTGMAVSPTYSYFRVYKQGDTLKRHTDRPACEISVSLCLGLESSSPWPLWVKGKSGPYGVELNAGDAVLYRGIEVEHWRTQFAGSQAVQVFLHYVDSDGPCAEWKFDKRERLNDFAHNASSSQLLQTLNALAKQKRA